MSKVDKYVVIAGTNRPQSNTKKVASQYFEMVKRKGVDVELVCLKDVDWAFYDPNHYTKIQQSGIDFQERIMIPATKFLFVAPEYNGSIPGILKLFIDACNVKESFHFKKACLVGLGSGRGGNMRGLDHLTGILNYLNIDVYHKEVTLPDINNKLRDGRLFDEGILKRIEKQIEGFIKF